jgi:6-phosphogluconolactonase (cycloisomerase 2 family)
LGSYALASPDGRWTAWLDADHVYLLNWQDGTVRRLTSGHWDGPRHVFFSSDCSTIGIVGIAGIRFFDTATLRMRTTIDIGHAQIVSVHTDGRMLALAHRYERRVDIWTFNVSDEWTPM